MTRGIIIFGSAGSGKTTLGRLVAKKLQYPYFDLDDYIWRKDTELPFTVMYTRDEKIDRLMTDISKHDHFVMAGSMDSFHTPFDPLFDLAVHLDADTEQRLSRIREREYRYYGNRILEGGDLYEHHCRFLESAARYHYDGSPNRHAHLEWAKMLPCKVLFLDGKEDLNSNMQTILEALHSITG